MKPPQRDHSNTYDMFNSNPLSHSARKPTTNIEWEKSIGHLHWTAHVVFLVGQALYYVLLQVRRRAGPLISDTAYQEIASDPAGKGLNPTSPPSTSDTSRKPRL